MIKEKRTLHKTIKLWPRVSEVVSTIHSEEHYNTVVSMLDDLLDDVNKKSDPVKESLIDTLGTLIKDYEDRKIKEPEKDPIGSLKYLMEEHGLTQHELKK